MRPEIRFPPKVEDNYCMKVHEVKIVFDDVPKTFIVDNHVFEVVIRGTLHVFVLPSGKYDLMSLNNMICNKVEDIYSAGDLFKITYGKNNTISIILYTSGVIIQTNKPNNILVDLFGFPSDIDIGPVTEVQQYSPPLKSIHTAKVHCDVIDKLSDPEQTLCKVTFGAELNGEFTFTFENILVNVDTLIGIHCREIKMWVTDNNNNPLPARVRSITADVEFADYVSVRDQIQNK